MNMIKKTVFSILFLALGAAPAWAQFAGAYDPQGVYLDGEGVFRSKSTDPDPRLKELRKKAKSLEKDEKLIYISLPRIFEEAKKYMEKGEPIPDEIRYLGGMVKLQYIFLYPEKNDIVIAGPAEPFDTKIYYRPLGKYTGRPVLHLDDLIVALRAYGSGKNPDRLGCDIEISAAVANRINKKVNEVIPKVSSWGAKKCAQEIAKAGGEQKVIYYGVDPNSRFAFVCVEADYRLKQLALGLMKSPVRKVKSYKSLITKPEKGHRFSLESNYEKLLVSPDGNAYEIRGHSLMVNTGVLWAKGKERTNVTKAAQRFKDGCNKNMEEMLKHMASWVDLANISDLSVLAAIIHLDGIPKKVGLDLSWVMDAEGYKVVKMKSPKSAQTCCNYHYAGRMVLFTSGGIWLNPSAIIKEREEGKVKTSAVRPRDLAWNTTRELDKK